MSAKKPALGRGLSTIIPDKISENHHLVSVENSDKIQRVNIDKIAPKKGQPRKNFNEDALLELADSIKQFGVIQPIIVHKKNDYFEIIAGERRWRASKMAGLKEIPVIEEKYTDKEILEISLIENIQRENLNPIEEAMAYQTLIDEFHLKQDEVAERVSKSRTAITNMIRLLRLDPRIQEMIVDEKLTSGHARTLLSIEDLEKQYFFANEIFEKGLTVREAEALIKSLQKPKKKEETKENNQKDFYIYKEIEEKIKSIIGSKVTIHKKSNDKGKIEIEYYSVEELEGIVELIEKISTAVTNN